MQVDEWLLQPLTDQTASLCGFAFVEQSEQVHILAAASLPRVRQETESLHCRSIETHVLAHRVLLEIVMTKIVFISCEVQIIYERGHCAHGDFHISEGCIEV